ARRQGRADCRPHRRCRRRAGLPHRRRRGRQGRGHRSAAYRRGHERLPHRGPRRRRSAHRPGVRRAGALSHRTTSSRRRRVRAAMTRRPPIALVVPAVAGLAFLVLPPIGLIVRMPWTDLASQLGDPATWVALRLSLVAATLATAWCLLLGVPLAWLLARTNLPGRRVIRALVTVPLILPPVV